MESFLLSFLLSDIYVGNHIIYDEFTFFIKK